MAWSVRHGLVFANITLLDVIVHVLDFTPTEWNPLRLVLP